MGNRVGRKHLREESRRLESLYVRDRRTGYLYLLRGSQRRRCPYAQLVSGSDATVKLPAMELTIVPVDDPELRAALTVRALAGQGGVR